MCVTVRSVCDRVIYILAEAMGLKEKFRSSYNASVEPNPPYLALTLGSEARILSCAGIPFADYRTLFSEQYLSQPIETINYGSEPARDSGVSFNNDVD